MISQFDKHLIKLVNILLAVVIVLLPFHAFLTVWGSSLLGHYTALRLWKEALLLVAGLAVLILLARRRNLIKRLARSWLARLVTLYVVINLVWGVAAYYAGNVSLKALAYGELVNLRFFAALLMAWVAASFSSWLINNWRRLVVWPAAGVMLVGLAQWLLLPYDFLRHFGYSDKTIRPFQTIDQDKNFIRIISTLRGSNLLGGYMIIMLSYLGAVFSRSARKWWIVAAVIASMGVLFASGSRGAWLGVLTAGAVLMFLQVSNPRLRRLMMLGGLAMLLVGTTGVLLLRNNDFVQNTFFHTDEHSRSKLSSNAAHFKSSWLAVKEVAVEPLGRGPGTAGPASVYNAGHDERISENYFLQIGQETGWLGLATFLAIYVLTALELLRRRHLLLSRLLLASMAGLTVMALLMHIWTDDTLAYLFWSLAGIVLASSAAKKSRSS